MLKILIINILCAYTLSWNANSCAWGVVGSNQPKNATECLGDQTNQVADCCYLKFQMADNSTFSACDILPKYITQSQTNEQLTIGAQNSIGVSVKVLEYTCKSSVKIEADKRNVQTSNSCAYSNVKFVAPNSESDCKDIDTSGLNKCCYIKSKWYGVETRSCSRFSKSDTEEAMKIVYKSMGGELEDMECYTSGNYLKLSFIFMLVLSILF